jgi:hypothetical protein
MVPMTGRGTTPREIAIPATAFGSLRRHLEKEAGPLPTVHALHHAGYAAGTAAAPALAAADAGSMAEAAFWTRLADFFGKRGWGSLRHARPHAAVGLLTSSDWAEASDGEGGSEASPIPASSRSARKVRSTSCTVACWRTTTWMRRSRRCDRSGNGCACWASTSVRSASAWP